MGNGFADIVRGSAGRTSGADAGRCLLIAEVAQAHDGSLGLAHAFVDAAARAGADAIKFQTHIADAESTPAEPWRVRFSPQDGTRHDYWLRTSFSESQWTGLRAHAEDVGLLFLSSPFSPEAVAMLSRVGVAAWKVPSGEVATPELLEQMAATGRPVLLSTGMSPLAEVDGAVERLRMAGANFAVMQCTSAYPCPAERVGLNLLAVYRERYGCAVGLSDHSGTIYPALAAVTLGAEVLEVHITLSREMYGPDVASSVTTSEFRQLADGVRFIERMQRNPVAKDAETEGLATFRAMFTKSVVAARALVAGQVIGAQDLAIRKPGTGLAAGRLGEIVGRRVRRSVAPWQPLMEDDLVPDQIGLSTANATGLRSQATRPPHPSPMFPMPASGPAGGNLAPIDTPVLSVPAFTEPPMRTRT